MERLRSLSINQPVINWRCRAKRSNSKPKGPRTVGADVTMPSSRLSTRKSEGLLVQVPESKGQGSGRHREKGRHLCFCPVPQLVRRCALPH